jgi:hypothetical protein
MEKRGCQGDFKCRFCKEQETIHHLFFTCAVAKYMVSNTFGATSRPGNFTQYFVCVAKFYPGRTNLHVVEVVALCWALWKIRTEPVLKEN